MLLRFSSIKMLGLCLASASMIACSAPTIRADVQAFPNSRVSLLGLHSFAYAPAEDTSHALRDQDLFQSIQPLLEEQGLVQALNPDFFVTLHTNSEPTSIEKPGHYEMGSSFRRGFYYTTYMRGGDGYLHPTQLYSPDCFYSFPYRVERRSVPAFAHHLDLEMRLQSGELLWQGSIDLVQRSRDLSKYMQLFLPQLLEEFPAPSGKGMQRKASFGN